MRVGADDEVVAVGVSRQFSGLLLLLLYVVAIGCIFKVGIIDSSLILQCVIALSDLGGLLDLVVFRTTEGITLAVLPLLVEEAR